MVLRIHQGGPRDRHSHIERSSISGGQAHVSTTCYGREQPPETGAQFYRLDHKASTLRAAELAGIELDEVELDEYDQKTSQPVSVRSIRDLKSLLKAVEFSAEDSTELLK